MRINFTFPLLILSILIMISCSKTPSEQIQSSVKDFLKAKLKKADKYTSISFTKIDTLDKKEDSVLLAEGSLYRMRHIYSIENSENTLVTMDVSFLIDKELKVKKTETESLNGDYGVLTGNAYWKYNNYVGNRPDAGTKVTLYPLDSIRSGVKYEATADVQGNYRIEKILPGKYLAIVRSENATDCPEDHLQRFQIYSNRIKQLFQFDLDKYKSEIQEIDKLQNEYYEVLMDDDDKKYGGLSGKIKKYSSIESTARDKANELINSFPDDFKGKIKLYTGYSNAYDFETIVVDETKTNNINSDFGITCI